MHFKEQSTWIRSVGNGPTFYCDFHKKQNTIWLETRIPARLLNTHFPSRPYHLHKRKTYVNWCSVQTEQRCRSFCILFSLCELSICLFFSFFLSSSLSLTLPLSLSHSPSLLSRNVTCGDAPPLRLEMGEGVKGVKGHKGEMWLRRMWDSRKRKRRRRAALLLLLEKIQSRQMHFLHSSMTGRLL